MFFFEVTSCYELGFAIFVKWVLNVFQKSEWITNGSEKISRKKGELKLIGSKSLDYTFLDNDFLNLKYTNISHKNDEDNSNNFAPKDSINKDIQRINKTDLEIAKSRYKGRITGGQSRKSFVCLWIVVVLHNVRFLYC